MKIFPAVTFLVIAIMMLSFSAISFMLFPRPLSLENPNLLVEIIFAAGLAFMAISIRQLHRQTIKIKD